MAEKIKVTTFEEMEKLMDEGVASIDDWKDFVDSYFGYRRPWEGFIYANLPKASAQFHLQGQHDQSSHGNWAEADSDEDVEPASSRTGDSASKVRAWAQEQGLEVGVRGRVSQEVVDAYDDYHGMYVEKKAEQPSAYSIADRRDAAIKAIGGSLENFGEALRIVDDSWDPQSGEHSMTVSGHLQDLSRIPGDVVDAFVKAGGKVLVGNGPITKVDSSLASLAGTRPRGWPEGTSYDDVAGCYNPQSGTVVLGNILEGRNTPVSNFAYHEFAHGLDALTKKVSLLSQEDRFTSLHQRFSEDASKVGKLNNYYVQSGTPGAGASEFFADSYRAYAKAQVRANNGFPEERNGVVRNAFAEAGTFVPLEVADLILKYWDEQTRTYSASAPAKPGAKGRKVRVLDA